MADTRILFVMINLTQSLQWESSWIVSDKIAFHSPLNFPAIFLFFLLCAQLWSDWTYCVSVTAHKYRDCWSSLLPIAEHRFFVPKWAVQHLKQNYTYSTTMTDQNLNSLQSFLMEFLSWQNVNRIIFIRAIFGSVFHPNIYIILELILLTSWHLCYVLMSPLMLHSVTW